MSLCRTAPPPATRRDWLRRCGAGLGSLALADLMLGTHARAATHFPAKAKRVIHLFMEGGPAHVDTFDPKPELTKRHKQTVPVPGQDKPGVAFGSPFKFRKAGKSGLEISEIYPELAKCADDLCVVRSLHTSTASHEQAMLLMNTGDERFVRPSVGSWVTYGLGSGNQNLPAFVVLLDEGLPLQGAQNWQAGFLPGVHQGTAVELRQRLPEKLIENVRSPHASAAEQRLQLDFLKAANQEHAYGRADDRLEARIESFELAYRMQAEATDAFDLAREPRRVRERYGDTAMGRQCLTARRLVERGVRFVQVYQGGWDNHADVKDGVGNLAKASDRPMAALLADLKERGLLDDTLVVWCGEFGRTPTTDAANSTDDKPGRDHNHKGFSGWLAGGGVKGGLAYGKTDELGWSAVEHKVHVHDLHATILHLLGFDHTKLTYRSAGRDFRLTDVHGEVVRGILA